MIENKNKTTGDYLSVIPKFTVNSTLSWQATQDLSMQSTLTSVRPSEAEEVQLPG